jgi:nephrocystin-3
MKTCSNRIIRVFLSSTLIDFQEERRLLVQQVFPRLRRRARTRGVELVDVDLRWGVTAEQAERGETLSICLAEIDRCRPYFIGMLGERYGWVPPPDRFSEDLLNREPWLAEYRGLASATEIEFLHGVLRNPPKDTQALIYLRDPAYAYGQLEPGWVAQDSHERERLAALKQQLHSSRFTITEDLADPAAIAKRVEDDLWHRIEQDHPEQVEPDRLTREEVRHRAYRDARTTLYIGGEALIKELEDTINSGNQRIVITGESGSGKSSLIANWMVHHEQFATTDVVLYHHLEYTKDTNDLRAVLGRLIDTASPLLINEGLIQEPLRIPEDWWDLTTMVAETFQNLGLLCQRHVHRWIWVLDGLDRLELNQQKALPWLPIMLPAGVFVVLATQPCPALEILRNCNYTSISIDRLLPFHREILINRYLARFTKQLTPELRLKILRHPLSGLPIYLRVLLEELRQCGSFDILTQQLSYYLSAISLESLFTLILSRLEADGHGEVLQRTMTLLWASRAGLSEDELLVITGLLPLQWAPVDLALEEAFGRNGNRLVFTNEHLRRAVEQRYIANNNDRHEAHRKLADWLFQESIHDKRVSEELPYQLIMGDQVKSLKNLILDPETVSSMVDNQGALEVLRYWQIIRDQSDEEIDVLMKDRLDSLICKLRDQPTELYRLAESLSTLFDEAGLYRSTLIRLRTIVVDTAVKMAHVDQEIIPRSLMRLAETYHYGGNIKKALYYYGQARDACEKSFEKRYPLTYLIQVRLAQALQGQGHFDRSELLLLECLKEQLSAKGEQHLDCALTMACLGDLYLDRGNYDESESFFNRSLAIRTTLLGRDHPDTLLIISGMAMLFKLRGDFDRALELFKREVDTRDKVLGSQHPASLIALSNLANFFTEVRTYSEAEPLFMRAFAGLELVLGFEHPATMNTATNYAGFLRDVDRINESIALYSRVLVAQRRIQGPKGHETLITTINLAGVLMLNGSIEEAEALYLGALPNCQEVFGSKHPDILRIFSNLAYLYKLKGDNSRALEFLQLALVSQELVLGANHPDTLSTRSSLESPDFTEYL